MKSVSVWLLGLSLLQSDRRQSAAQRRLPAVKRRRCSGEDTASAGSGVLAATSSAACSQPCALQANAVRSVKVKRKTGHSEVVSAQAETAERQAPCTADGQAPNSLCRERSPSPACRARALFWLCPRQRSKGWVCGVGRNVFTPL